MCNKLAYILEAAVALINNVRDNLSHCKKIQKLG